jgi:hypothetical protein
MFVYNQICDRLACVCGSELTWLRLIVSLCAKAHPVALHSEAGACEAYARCNASDLAVAMHPTAPLYSLCI